MHANIISRSIILIHQDTYETCRPTCLTYYISHLIARQLTQHPGLLSSAMTSLGLHMTLPKIPWDTKRFPWKPVWTGRWTQPRDWSRFLTPWETDWQRMRPHRRRSFASGGKGHTHSKTQVFQRWGGSVRPFVARKITTATAALTIKGSQ